MIAKIKIFSVLTIPMIAIAPIIDFKATAWILFWLFIFDFITGVLASYFTWKESDKKDHWFFGKGEGFSSDKAKKCFIKGLVYLTTPLIANQFIKVFFIQNMKLASLSSAEFTVATGLIMCFICIELFSIFFENLPKCGFNIFEKFKKIVKQITLITKEIK